MCDDPPEDEPDEIGPLTGAGGPLLIGLEKVDEGAGLENVWGLWKQNKIPNYLIENKKVQFFYFQYFFCFGQITKSSIDILNR